MPQEHIPNLTIIIPFYNSGKFIHQCLQSIIEQSYQDFLVVLVNDGSTDDSEEVVNSFIKNYPNKFKLIRQKNSGQGAARNNAFKNVSTPYVMFVDSDDFLGKDALASVFKLVNEEYDAVFFNPVIFDAESKDFWEWYDKGLVKYIFNKNPVAGILTNPELLSTEISLNRCVWKTSFLKENNFHYPENIKWEDIPPHFLITHKIRKCVFCDSESIYYYRINSGNQSTSKISKTCFDIPKVYNSIIEVAKSEQWTDLEIVYVFRFINIYARWAISEIDGDRKKQLINEFHNLYKKIPYKIVRKMKVFPTCIKASRKDKAFAYLLKSNLGTKIYCNEKLLIYIKKVLRKLRLH